MSTMPWIKSKTSQLKDPRITRLSKDAQLHYFKLNLLAGVCDSNGAFILNGIQLTDDEIARELITDIKTLKRSWAELKQNKLIHVNGRGPQLTDFGEEQVSQEERREKWRAQKQDQRSNADTASRPQPVREDTARTPAPRVRTRIQSKNQSKNQSKKPPTPNPSPSSGRSRSGRLAGSSKEKKSLQDEKQKKIDFKTLKPDQRNRMELAKRILQGFSLRNPKLETLLSILAMRNFKTDKDLITSLFSIGASVFSDTSIKSPEAVLIYRIERDQSAAGFEKPSTWRSVPRKALEAAGIDNLDTYRYRL